MIPRRDTPERTELVDALRERATFVRTETVRLSRIAGAGHYASTFSAAELFAALYYSAMRLDPTTPDWVERDRFVLSKGHAAIGLYPILADLGYFDPAILDEYTRMGSTLGDHPDMKKIPGCDFSSGSLGHGLSAALGIALAGRMQGHDYLSYCMLGDGELAEGQIWEAAMAAGHHRVGNLVGIVDRNQLCIDGFVDEVMSVEPLTDRFASFGWDVRRIDGHDLDAILDVLSDHGRDPYGAPRMIIADTIKGRGVERMELSPHWHVGNLVGDDYDDVMAELAGGLQERLAP